MIKKIYYVNILFMEMSEISKLLLSAIISVFYLFIISKMLGKKQIAQLEFVDYVLGISIGSIAAEMAFDTGDRPFYYYLLAMTIFFLFDLMVSYLGRKGAILKHFFKGRPEVIIYDGKINYKALKKSKLDVNDVLALCRDKDYFDISDVAYAIFETSGKLSIMPKSNQKPVVIEDLNKKLKPASLPYYLIVDGRISYSSLRELKKDERWIFEKAKLNKDKLKNVILAIYNEEKDKIELQTKYQ